VGALLGDVPDRTTHTPWLNSQVLVMPFAIHLAPICRAILPVSVCDATVEWFGVLDSMNDFKGRGAGGKAPYPVGSSVKTRSSPKVA